MNCLHVRFLQIAVVYLLVGMVLGLYMGISGDHKFYPAHAHINLVGWVAFALYGIVYRLFPSATETNLAKLHFWLANLGAVLISLGVFGINAGMEKFVPVAGAGAVVSILGAATFAIVLFTKLGIPTSRTQ